MLDMAEGGSRMKRNKGLLQQPRIAQRGVSRERLEEMSRAGPWDVQLGWAPTSDEDLRRVARAEASKPFWASWDREEVESINQIHRAFTFIVAGSMSIGFNPEKMPGHARETFSPEDREIYDRFIAWLKEMHHAGLRNRIAMVRDVLVLEEPCREPHILRGAVKLHVELRKRS